MEKLTGNLTAGLEKIARALDDWFVQHGINIIAILVGAWLIRRFGARVISEVLRKTIRTDLYPTRADREKRLKTLNSLVSASTRLGVYIIAGILIIGEINPQYATALFAGAGLITVAIGFGAQSLVKDFVSGIFIIMENQYRVGDNVTLGNYSGTVEGITIRTTTLRDDNGYLHHVPNGTIQVTTNKSINYTRLDENLTIAGKVDLDRLTHIINHIGEELAARHDMAQKIIEPFAFSRVERLEGNKLVVKITGKTRPGSFLRIRGEFYKELHKSLVTHDIKLDV